MKRRGSTHAKPSAVRASALAVYETLKALREGVSPKDLKGVPSADFVNRYMRNSAVQQRMAGFLGIKKG